VRLVQDTDPETEALEEVVDYWKNQLGVDVGYKTHEILARATNIPDFYSALINAAGYRGNIDARRLGDWLRFRQGRVVSSGLKIVGKARVDGAKGLGAAKGLIVVPFGYERARFGLMVGVGHVGRVGHFL
jgi:hypothetical protein